MIIGIDFDNTIVCYDQVFHKIALEKNLIPQEIPVSKKAVRDYLRNCNKEDDWTELQGYVYGTRMPDAEPFPDVLNTIAKFIKQGITVYIISHKTRHPYIGPKYDLHKAAREWLELKKLFDSIGMPKENAFFELTLLEKIQKIKEKNCDYFIDDLPELFNEISFPENTNKILFDPNNNHQNENVFKHVNSWGKIDSIISNEFELRENIKKLLPPNNKKFKINLLKGGGNNKVFKVNDEFLLKSYFKHENDKRDRLNSEFSFAKFAWNNDIKTLPKPYACDKINNLGLYEFINGRRLQSTEIDECVVQQAIDFYLEINKHKNTPEAKKLPFASEACFSIAEHINCVEKRIKIVKTIENIYALKIIENELIPKWLEIKSNIDKNEIQSTKIDDCNRCLSPSDFGFHNAILTIDEKLKFIDFEYAGWDDPAKMVCDFFCQPEIPVPIKYFDFFTNEISKCFSDNIKERINLLFPVYQIKWCCIMLNEFLTIGDKRRRFAGRSSEQKTAQINKVKLALTNIS